MAFALVNSSVKAYPEGAESPFRNCFEQVLEFNVTAANTDQELNLATLATNDATNGPGILTLLSKVSRMNGCLVLQSARASEGAFATGNATITNYTNLLPVSEVDDLTFPAKIAANAVAADYVAITDTAGNKWAVGLKVVAADLKDKNTVTWPAVAGATEGDFIQLTDAAGGKWAIVLDKDGGGVINAGPVYAASTPIVVDISGGAVTAIEVAALVKLALPAPFNAVFTSVDVLDGTMTFEAKTVGACAAAVPLNAAEGGAGSITFVHNVTGILATTDPTGADSVAATAPRRAMLDINGTTHATSVAAAVQPILAGLAGIAAVITVAAAAVGVIRITHVAVGNVTNPAPHNAADGGAGSITVAEITPGRLPDVITVGVTTFTAQAAAVTLGQGTFRALTDVNTTAVSLAAQINGHAVAGALVTATAAAAPSGVVTITADQRGDGGNLIALAFTDGAGQASIGATVSGAFLTGGLPTAGYYISGTAAAPVFNFPGATATPTALHFVLRFRLMRDETPFIINAQ